MYKKDSVSHLMKFVGNMQSFEVQETLEENCVGVFIVSVMNDVH